MVSQDSLLVTLVTLVDRLPMPALAMKRGRGHPKVSTDQLFLKGLSHHDRTSLVYAHYQEKTTREIPVIALERPAQ